MKAAVLLSNAGYRTAFSAGRPRSRISCSSYARTISRPSSGAREQLHPIEIAPAPTIIDPQILSYAPTQGLQPLCKCRQTSLRFWIVGCDVQEHADARYAAGLLRLNVKETNWCEHPAAQQRNELAPFHRLLRAVGLRGTRL